MFKTCSDPDFNWVHCLCDSATWVVEKPVTPTDLARSASAAAATSAVIAASANQTAPKL